MLFKFSTEQRELPWQSNLGTIGLICTDFGSVQDIETLFGCRMWYLGSPNLNMLSAFSREQWKLPWQPNLGKNKPKLHRFGSVKILRHVLHVGCSFRGR